MTTATIRFGVAEGSSVGADVFDAVLPHRVRELLAQDEQKAIPAIARTESLYSVMEECARALPSSHHLTLGDCRDMGAVADESVHLVVTSPPYWTLKDYLPNEAQLGAVRDYDAFLDELDSVWRHVLRVLVPGGRLVVVVGDVCVSRKRFGRHVVFPLHASIQERCRVLGFDNLAPIIWHKIANAQFETEGNGAAFLGKPYEPNSVIKNDIEYILFQRKPGGYRQPSAAMRALSAIPEPRHREWFQQIWTLSGASTREHPAPFPLPLAERLVRMFSFVGDTVLDPFLGSGTTSAACAVWGRNSTGFEVEAQYYAAAVARLEAAHREHASLLAQTGLFEPENVAPGNDRESSRERSPRHQSPLPLLGLGG